MIPLAAVLVLALTGPAPLTLEDTAGRGHAVPAARSKVTLLFFIGHDCPISNAYAPEIGRIVREYGKKGAASFVVYVDPDLTAAAAKKHAKAFSLPSPTLLDSQHRLVKRTEATVTPEAAILSPTGEVLYRGRIDDTHADLGKRRPAPTTRDLRGALDQALAGKPITTPRTKAVGCLIPGR